MSPLADYAARIRESIPEALVETRTELGMDVLVVRAEHVASVGVLLRDEFGFDMLMDVSGVDFLGSQGAASRHPGESRYDINYHLLNLENQIRVRVKVQLPDSETPRVPSVTSVWPGAEWHEREVYDFFGIVFDSHPDLRRILMPDEWIGHPLRKDYPVGGVPVEYKIEPAYVGANIVPSKARPAAGGVPARLRRDRGRRSHWTWSGPPASDVRRVGGPMPPDDTEGEEPPS